MIELFEFSESFLSKKNKEGVKLREEFKYSDTLDKILKIINDEK